MANNSKNKIEKISNNSTSKGLLSIYKAKNNNALKKLSTDCGKCKLND